MSGIHISGSYSTLVTNFGLRSISLQNSRLLCRKQKTVADLARDKGMLIKHGPKRVYLEEK